MLDPLSAYERPITEGEFMKKYAKCATLMAIIVGSLGFLAYSRIQGNSTYCKIITEVRQMGINAKARHVRVGGDVQSSSIVHAAGLITFNLVQEKQISKSRLRRPRPAARHFPRWRAGAR
jgi:hypothetical protein